MDIRLLSFHKTFCMPPNIICQDYTPTVSPNILESKGTTEGEGKRDEISSSEF